MITLLVTLVIAGLILHLVNAYMPMDPPVKTVLNVVVILILCVWLLRVFGFVDIPFRLR